MSMRSSLHSLKNSKYGCPMATSYSLHLQVSLPLVPHHLLTWPPLHIPLNPGMESNSTPKSLTHPWVLRSSQISLSKYANVVKTGKWRTSYREKFNESENWSENMRSEEHTSELQSLRHLVC